MGAESEGDLIPDIMDFWVMALLLRDSPRLIDEGQGSLEIPKLIRLQQLRAFQLPASQAGQGRLDLFGSEGGAHENSLFQAIKGVNAGLRDVPHCE
jgi:hypothetical protein